MLILIATCDCLSWSTPCITISGIFNKNEENLQIYVGNGTIFFLNNYGEIDNSFFWNNTETLVGDGFGGDDGITVVVNNSVLCDSLSYSWVRIWN